jgi:hypothetical protein
MAWVEVPAGEPLPPPAERSRRQYFAAHPVIAEINRGATLLMETISPMLWAGLIVLAFWAEVMLD